VVRGWWKALAAVSAAVGAGLLAASALADADVRANASELKIVATASGSGAYAFVVEPYHRSSAGGGTGYRVRPPLGEATGPISTNSPSCSGEQLANEVFCAVFSRRVRIDLTGRAGSDRVTIREHQPRSELPETGRYECVRSLGPDRQVVVTALLGPGGDTFRVVAAEAAVCGSADLVPAAPYGIAVRQVSVDGGPGEDDLAGSSGGDTIRGGGGLDTLAGGAGDDTLWADDDGGSPLADIAREDTVSCGAGRDTAYVDDTDAVSGCERVLRHAPGDGLPASVVGDSLTVQASGATTVQIRCPYPGDEGGCKGTLRLRAQGSAATLAQAGYDLPLGLQVTVPLQLSRPVPRTLVATTAERGQSGERRSSTVVLGVSS
jgi:hypothetical protein